MAQRKSVWALALELRGDDKNATAALKTVQAQIKNVQGATKQLGNDFRSFAGNAGKLAAGVAGGVAAAGAATFALANSFANAGVEVGRSARAVNMCVVAYQQLQFAMEQSQVAAGEFDYAMRRYNQTIMQAAAGNEAAQRKLDQIGLSGKKLAEMGPEKALLRLSDYLKALPTDAERTAVALTLFGNRAGPQMAAALSQGSDAIKALKKESVDATFTFSEQQIELSKQFANTRRLVGGAFQNIKFSFIADAIGPVNQAMKTLQQTILSGVPSISKLGARFGAWLNDAVQRLPEIIARIREFGQQVWANVLRVKDFVGGWRNVALILGGLAIAPTFLSGLKVVWSLATLIKVTFSAIPKFLKGLKGGFALIAKATLPITGIFLGIGAVIYTVIRNFDTLREYALNAINRIRAAFGGTAGEMSVDWQRMGEIARTVLGVIEKITLVVIKTVIEKIVHIAQVFGGIFRIIQGDWGGLIQIFTSGFDFIRNTISNIITVFGGNADLFQQKWDSAIEAVKGFVMSIPEAFIKIFDRIRGLVESFIGFFKDRFASVSNIVGNIGNTLSNLNPFRRNRGEKIPQYAEGGIFMHRHIAEIAEKGAEAVVPLNNSPGGFDIWKRAGELGGYLQKQAQSLVKPQQPPVMAAATSKISGGEQSFRIEVNQNFNFNGGQPDAETIREVKRAGQQTADDLRAKIISVMTEWQRDQRRAAFV